MESVLIFVKNNVGLFLGLLIFIIALSIIIHGKIFCALAKITIPYKLRRIQKRLRRYNYKQNRKQENLDEYLKAANKIASMYFDQNGNILRRLYEYWGLKPECLAWATYTYSAFILLVEQEGVQFMLKDVHFVIGVYSYKNKIRGLHAWLEKNGSTYETIPHMRNLKKASYWTGCAFQYLPGSHKVFDHGNSAIMLIYP